MDAAARMQRAGLPLTEATFASVLGACARARRFRAGAQAHGQKNELLWSPMVVALMRFGLLGEALDFLERMPVPRDVFAWTAVISGFGKGTTKCCGKALELFVRLLDDDGVTPNDSDALDDALLVYNDLEMPSLITSNTLIAGLISMGRTEDAKMVFSQMPEHDLGSYNLMIKAYAMDRRLEDCRWLFEKIPRRNMVSLNSMMSVLLQNGRLEEGLKLFEQIKDERDTITWNSMISGYIRNDQPSEALKLFVGMCRLSIGWSHSTFSALLHPCATIGTHEQGKMVHAHLCKTPFDSVGDVKSAFGYITSPNVASWTSLINGLAQNGHWLEALVQFGRMLRHHIDPNEITFLGLLIASARAGLVNKGMKIFRSMENYGLVPTVEHYTCAVDLLGRTGRTREAEKFICVMPVPADGVVWGALLTACWYSMDLDMDEKVAWRLFCMGTTHRYAYVAMPNIYAKLGKWEDVVKVRTRLRSLNAKKEPGCSWIEIKDIVYVFLADDQNHPERDKIGLMLEYLVSHISLDSEPDDLVIQSLNYDLLID
ncbi:Pentatricopeptide repeat-containing protein [Dichanthelium oligosanthes]|uniref:Pentatricopeptide repeat-containing protein n=1 Tax=Dichanthelium oligosanthes TaxID=888268 RepID=A0A1E5V359_9POAL|nr:Pentatricopeptide repeat-containing protein [Dichanthelium oligosanthes]